MQADELLERAIKEATGLAYLLGHANHDEWSAMCQLVHDLKKLRKPGTVERLDAERLERARA